jgi:hypothetical protein
VPADLDIHMIMDNYATPAIRAYIDARNEDPKPFKWVRTADDILEAVNRFCLRSSSENYEAYL